MAVQQSTDSTTIAGGNHGLTRPTRRLGDILVEFGFAERGVVEATVALAREDGRPIGQALVESKVIDSSQLARALAERNRMEYVDLSHFEVDYGAANLISNDDVRRYNAIPIAFVDEHTLLVVTANPSNLLGLDNVGLATGRKVTPVVASPEDIEALMVQLSQRAHSVQEVEIGVEEAEEETTGFELEASADDGPVVKLLHSIIADAVCRGASDVHLDPSAGDLRVRYRIDGVVIDSASAPRRLSAGLISRIKIMAELDIAERRAPQDGRIGVTVDGRFVDIRVAILPVLRGESAVLRILDKSRIILELDELGMSEQDGKLVSESVNRTHGAVLVTGPTGSGKTTTLYAILNAINTSEKTLIAIEDPVEYELAGVKQIQVNPKAGVNFASGLRSIVRADPDILMVGEIRDRETAQTAIESALTGHLILSTLHTGDAPTAPARLVEMGIEPFLIASGIHCVIGQRLARRLCDDCKAPLRISVEELRRSGFDTAAVDVDGFKPEGCVRCNGSGFKGRIGIYEVMMVTDEIGALILKRGSSTDIADAAAAGGMRRMRADGLEKVRLGITSVPEVLRVLGA